MKINYPVEVLDKDCEKCNQIDIRMVGDNDLWAGCKLLVRNVHAECSHLDLCKYIRNRYKEEKE